MRAGDRDSALDAHDLGEHFGPFDDGEAGGPRGNDLRVALVDRARVDDDVRAGDVLGAMALVDLDAEALQAHGRLPEREIRPGHVEPDAFQQLGEAAHADAADPDEVEALHPQEIHAASTSKSRSHRREAASGAAERRAASPIARSRSGSPRRPASAAARVSSVASASVTTTAAPSDSRARAFASW